METTRLADRVFGRVFGRIYWKKLTPAHYPCMQTPKMRKDIVAEEVLWTVIFTQNYFVMFAISLSLPMSLCHPLISGEFKLVTLNLVRSETSQVPRPYIAPLSVLPG